MQTPAAGIPLVPAVHILYPVAARYYAGSASPYYQQKSRQWCVLCHSGHRMNGCGFSLLCRVCRPYGHIFPSVWASPLHNTILCHSVRSGNLCSILQRIGTIGGGQRESGNGNAGIQISHIRVLSYISNQNDFIY